MARLVQLEPGEVYARDYRIVRALREGGMGALYVVEQLSTAVPRALKVMQPDLLLARDPAAAQRNRERFLEEARISGRIPSEHVVQVLAAGIDESTGAPWMVMELLDGEDVGGLLVRRGHLEAREVLAVFEDLCHALGAAHRVGVVHLDLKPENVFVARAQRRDVPFTVKVLDFGIARMVQDHRRSTTMTTSIGSPMWMAPEQTSSGSHVSAATDVWALGLMAYTCLTGRSYWREGAQPGGDFNLMAWLLEMMSAPLEPASTRAREHGVDARLPAGFDAWFARCVVREREARFADASVAMTGLRAVLASSPFPATRTMPSLLPEAPAGDQGYAPTAFPATAAPAVYAPAAFPATTLPPVRSRTRLALAIGGGVIVLGAAVFGLVHWISSGPPPRPLASTKAPAAPTSPGPKVAPPAPSPCPKDMVLVPGGTFVMGSPEGQGEKRERPAHKVRLSPYCMDRTEVTVAAYRTCVTAGRCTAAHAKMASGFRMPSDLRLYSQWCNRDMEDRALHPVNCVDWHQAVAYCRSVDRRLPTEAEWELAARGTDGRIYPWGNEPPAPERLNACGKECVAMFRRVGQRTSATYPGDDGWGATAPVGTYPAGASPFGILDMAGNVWEWTADRFGRYPATPGDPIENPKGPASGVRVIRGTSWDYILPTVLRSTTRRDWPSSERWADLGFRCAKTVGR
jgi:eukaryotic-like serine/threonine-protein kinase